MSEAQSDPETDNPKIDAAYEIEMLDAGGVLYGLDFKPPIPHAFGFAT